MKELFDYLKVIKYNIAYGSVYFTLITFVIEVWLRMDMENTTPLSRGLSLLIFIIGGFTIADKIMESKK